MGYCLISNLAIVKWFFSPANVDQFHVSDHPWEVISLSLHLSTLNLHVQEVVLALLP